MEDKNTRTDQVPTLFGGDLVRRLEGETPEGLLPILRSLKRGPLAVSEIFERVFKIDVKEHYHLDDSCKSRMHIFADDLFPTDQGNDLQIRCLREDLEEAMVRADALAMAVLHVFWIYRRDYLSHDTILNIRVGYFYMDLYGSLEGWFKFQTTYLSAVLLKQKELPEVPKFVTRPGFVCGGKFFRVMRNLINKVSLTQEATSWAASIVALKRAALPLRSDLIADSLEKHRSTLEKQATMDHTIYGVLQKMDDCLERVWPMAASPLEGPVSHLKERMPSPSSHFGWSRAEGGAVGRVVELIEKEYGFMANHSTEFVGYSHTNWFRGCPIRAIYVPSYSFDLAGRIAQKAMEESLDCDVHVVLEPMKARIITSGPPLRYHINRMVQKEVHGAMRKLPEYQLIGAPITEDVLRKNFYSMHSWQRNWEFVSADYSAATDNLNGHLSLGFVEGVSKRLNLSDDVRAIYTQSMTGHTLHYPEEYGGFISKQNTGQLMGSPSSFPGLCLINLATLYYAWDRYAVDRWNTRKNYTQMLRDLRPLVNGDDLLFVCPPEFIPYWRECVKAVGLAPSPGKNYVSRDFVVINSTFFQLTWIDERFTSAHRYIDDETEETYKIRFPSFTHSITFDRVHWVGSGLLKGQARVLSDTRRPGKDSIDFGQLRSQLEWVLDWPEGWEEQRVGCLAVWFSYMRETLLEQDRSWRLPVALGGLGLPLGGATRPQLVLANVIVKTSDLRLSAQVRERSRFAPQATTSAQLIAEAEFLREAGAKKVLRSQLPYHVLRKAVITDGVETSTVEVRDANVHDISISPYVVGLSHHSLLMEEKEEWYLSFSDRMTRVINRWKGGPMDLDEAVKWNGSTCWTGGYLSIPNVHFGLGRDGGRALELSGHGLLDQINREKSLCAGNLAECSS